MDWILSIKKDGNRALTDLYTLYRSDCLHWIKTNFNIQENDALDIFQLSVVILYDNVLTGRLATLSTDIKTYLYGIARNKAYELLRKEKKNESALKATAIMEYVTQESETELKLENQLTTMLICLEKLGDPCKSLLQLFYYSDMDMEQIGLLMGYKNADTVKNQKYKCLKRLQKIFNVHITKTSVGE